MVDNDLIYRDNGAGAEDGAEAGAGVAPLEDFDDFELSDIDTPDLNHPHALSHAGMNDGDFIEKRIVETKVEKAGWDPLGAVY